MREIKFRGLNPYSREWVYGYYVVIRRHVEQACIWQEGDSPVSVDVETVGQYTGLQDKHGREIYEGDILKTEGDRILHVVWHEHGFCWDAIQVNIDPPESPIASSELRYLKTVDFEIIGNIYEHPDLVQGLSS